MKRAERGRESSRGRSHPRPAQVTIKGFDLLSWIAEDRKNRKKMTSMLEQMAKLVNAGKLRVSMEEMPLDPVCKFNLQPDFNVRVRDSFDAISSAVLRELDESNRFVQKSAESTSI